MNTRFGLGDKRIAVIRGDQARAQTIAVKLQAIGARILDIRSDGPNAPIAPPLLKSLDGVVAVASPREALPPPINATNIASAIAAHYSSQLLRLARLIDAGSLNDGASIVFIASLDAQVVRTGSILHSGAMSALVSSAKCLALELAPKRIRVNCLCPPSVESLDPETRHQVPFANTPAFSRLDDAIADTTAFFLCDASRWITGQAVPLRALTNA